MFFNYYGAVPKWLKGKVCKTFIRRFESDRRLKYYFLSMFTVYILRSEKANKRYIGFTDNIQRRLFEHNSGYVTSTKHRRPLKLIYSEMFKSKIDAMNREKFLKSHSGRDFFRFYW